MEKLLLVFIKMSVIIFLRSIIYKNIFISFLYHTYDLHINKKDSSES